MGVIYTHFHKIGLCKKGIKRVPTPKMCLPKTSQQNACHKIQSPTPCPGFQKTLLNPITKLSVKVHSLPI